jgi:hypothetical protein
MPEDHIQQLIDSIEHYDETDRPPYYVLWYIDGEEYETPDQYFAVMAIKMRPDKYMMEDIKRQSKQEIGNIIYAADYLIYNKDQAIDHLESLIDD